MKNKKLRIPYQAGSRTRTGDLLITNQLLYQLSHTSVNIGIHSFFIIQHFSGIVKGFRKNLIKGLCMVRLFWSFP